MPVDPIHALQAGQRSPAQGTAEAGTGTLLVAGATGVLGQELVRRLAGRHRFDHMRVLVREPVREGLSGVETVLTPDAPIDEWPLVEADTALILFEPPRLYYDRERALWTPTPDQLPALARWLRSSGVESLAVVQPHAQGRLPEALKRGLASLDEQAVVAEGFERVILVRTAQKPTKVRQANPAERLAAWMLSITRFMVPTSEQPVRASKVAELVDVALRLAPAGARVMAPEMVWQASQGDVREIVEAWVAETP